MRSGVACGASTALVVLTVLAVPAARAKSPSPAAQESPAFEIARPDLRAVDPLVREQLERVRLRVDALLADDRASGVEAVDAVSLLGELYLAYDFLVPATQCLAWVQRRSPGSFRAAYLRAYGEERLGRDQEARAALDVAIRQRPHDPAALVRLARLLLDADGLQQDPGDGRIERARELLRRALDADPGCAGAEYGLAEIARRDGDLETALVHYRGALERRQDLGSARYALGQTLRALGRLDEARSELEKVDLRAVSRGRDWSGCEDPVLVSVRARMTGAAPHLLRATLAHFDGNVERERRELEQAVHLAPRDPVAHKSLAAVLVRLGESEQAIRHYLVAIEHDPENASYHFDLAEVRRASGAVDAARDGYRRALELAPAFTLPMLELAHIDFSQRQFADAARQYMRVLELEPTTTEARMPLALSFVQLDRRSEALEQIDLALEEMADVVAEARAGELESFLQLVELQLILGQVEEAMLHFEVLVARSDRPGVAARAHMWIGAVVLGRGDSATARGHLEMALELDPGLEQAREFLAQASAGE